VLALERFHINQAPHVRFTLAARGGARVTLERKIIDTVDVDPFGGASVQCPVVTLRFKIAHHELTERFATAWNNLDSWGVAQLWTPDGHVAHEDGVVERGRMAINQARATMFARREYRWSRHDLSAGELTFAGPDVAIATGRWSLVNVRVPGREYPDSMGLAAFTFRKTPDEGWLFLALQYVERERGLPPPMTHVQGIDRR